MIDIQQLLQDELVILPCDIQQGDITIKAQKLRGGKVGQASGAVYGEPVKGSIIIDTEFVEYGNLQELVDTIKHELAHLITMATVQKSNSKGRAIRVWHGQEWKDIFISLGGSGDRYYKGEFKKEQQTEEYKKMKRSELYKILPTKPANTWFEGTYNQWLRRGYHVIKGEKGAFRVWEYVAEESESKHQDGKTHNGYGKAGASYFTSDQVQPNQTK